MKNNNMKKQQYISGLRAGLPVILGFVPVGIAYAIMARQAGFSIGTTVWMSLSVFAGASQMMAVGMYAQGASVIAMIIATFILNLRHLIMSICVHNKMKDGSLPMRLLVSFGVTDESFAIFTTEPEEKASPRFFLGLITVTYVSWFTGSLIGAVASDFLPPVITASLGVALYAMFIGLLVPGLKGNLKLLIPVVFTAICNTILSLFLTSGWSLILSTLIGAGIGVALNISVEPESKENGEEAK